MYAVVVNATFLAFDSVQNHVQEYEISRAQLLAAEMRSQQRNEADMVRVQQMALQRGASASGQGGLGES